MIFTKIIRGFISDEHLSGTFKNTIAQIKTEYRK
ncbi:DUF2594 family protein [Morganella morganii]